MAELFRNLARSTLATGISAVDLSLTVQSGDGNLLFPSPTSPDFFRCVLFKKATGDVEIITVTARTGDTFTIARAQENIGNVTATAFSFDAGDLVELRPTRGFFDSITLTSSNVQSGIFLYGVDTGVSDAYVVAMSPAAVGISDGQEIRVKIGTGNTNTGIAATLKLDALAATSILMEDGSNPPANSIKAGFTHTFVYNGTNFVFRSVGLVLTTTAFNALNKQIKNVAAGTAATDVATIGGTETLVGKTLTSPIINTPTIATPTITAPTINGVNGYGLVMLAAPFLLVFSTVRDTDTLLDMLATYAQAATDGAKIAIIGIQTTVNNNAASTAQSDVFVHTTAPGTTLAYRKLRTHQEEAATVTAYGSVEVTIVLDSSSNFYWRHQERFADAVNTFSIRIYLIGYYV